jgi:MSHA biogenesis protein MshJ
MMTSPVMQRWRHWSDLFNARSPRERVLMTVGVAAVVVVLFDLLALSPLAAQRQQLSVQLSTTRNTIRAGEIALSASRGPADPDEVGRRYRDELRRQIAEIDAKLQGLQKQLVPPDEVNKLLQGVLKRESGLTLVGLRKLPVQRLQTAGRGGQPIDNKPVTGVAYRSVYQHSFEISIEGSYAELHGYLARLEVLPWQLFWGRVVLDASEHPRLKLTLTLHTLSLNKDWLVV